MFFCKNRKTITIFIIFFVSFIGCYIHRFHSFWQNKDVFSLYSFLLDRSFFCIIPICTVENLPDEFMRYDVVNYIVTYGRLPLGNDPILLKTNGWGTSYAFQPYLAYMIDAGISKVFYVDRDSPRPIQHVLDHLFFTPQTQA